MTLKNFDINDFLGPRMAILYGINDLHSQLKFAELLEDEIVKNYLKHASDFDDAENKMWIHLTELNKEAEKNE